MHRTGAVGSLSLSLALLVAGVGCGRGSRGESAGAAPAAPVVHVEVPPAGAAGVPAAQAAPAAQDKIDAPPPESEEKKSVAASGGFGGASAPSLRQGAVTVTGKLSPEVVNRVVRQSFGRFRLCYENGLRSKPTLAGRVSATFTIDGLGAVTRSSDGGSDLPDKEVIGCVLRALGSLSFPQPEGGGEVTVVYPILFSSGTR